MAEKDNENIKPIGACDLQRLGYSPFDKADFLQMGREYIWANYSDLSRGHPQMVV